MRSAVRWMGCAVAVVVVGVLAQTSRVQIARRPHPAPAFGARDNAVWESIPFPASCVDARLGRDPARGVLVTLDTCDAGGTWEWDGDWRQRAGVAPPDARDAKLAWDGAKLVLYGGGGAIRRETWTWDGHAWQSRVFDPTPSPRIGHAMAYDEARRRLVLYGSMAGETDTWEWDGTRWAIATPQGTDGPGKRASAAFAYDARIGEVVLFGGFRTTDVPYEVQVLDDTWKWNGARWARIGHDGDPAPRARANAALAYSPQAHALVLYGGAPALFGEPSLDDEWQLDASGWTRRRAAALRARATRVSSTGTWRRAA